MNVKEVKEHVAMTDVVRMLGLRGTVNEAELRCKCPTCPSSSDRSLSINFDWRNKDGSIGSFKCWHSQAYGDLFALVCHVNGVRFKEALTQVSEHFRLNGDAHRAPEPAPQGRAGQEPQATTGALSPLSYLEYEHKAVQDAQISPEDAEKLGIGFAPKGMMKGRLAVPVRSPEGKLLGYVGIMPGSDVKVPSTWKY